MSIESIQPKLGQKASTTFELSAPKALKKYDLVFGLKNLVDQWNETTKEVQSTFSNIFFFCI